MARDPLDRYYTPDALAEAIVERVLVPMLARLDLEAPRILEPCVGGGAFVRPLRKHLPDARIHGNDVDPEAVGLELCDTYSIASFHRTRWTSGAWDVVIGNPYFYAADEVVRTTIRLWPTLTLYILPWALGGQSEWNPWLHLEPSFLGVQPLQPRPWEELREAALYMWGGSARVPADAPPREPRLIPPLVWR